MTSLALAFLIVAALGSGLMAGLFCVFSNFMMRALDRIPTAAGIATMQSINRAIVNPAFMLVFFGTGVACVLALVLGWTRLGGAASGWAIAGGTLYLAGSLGVTMACNVPLNKRLAALDPASEDGARMWAIYRVDWVRWNHLRSIATLLSALCLIVAVWRQSS